MGHGNMIGPDPAEEEADRLAEEAEWAKRTITVADFRANPAAAWERAEREGDIVLVGEDGKRRGVLHWMGHRRDD